jgi:hypothetical protein
MRSEATLSDDRLYRFRLVRVWGEGRPLVVIGLNPSTADEHTDDPTIRKCVKFARAWGCGSLVMVNLFAWRSTDPKMLKSVSDPIGENNDGVILMATRDRRASVDEPMILCAWGNGGELHGRGAHVAELLRRMGRELLCLKVNENREPAHPLYQQDSATPFLYVR